MSDASPLGSATSLRNRPAGYSVVCECLAFQALATPRSALKRILGFNPLHPDAHSWYSGAIGEMHVGDKLERLGAEWTVLHAVPVGKDDSDIDHVIIGPPGVFTVNTKRSPGAKIWVAPRTLLVAGQKTSYLRNSRHEAGRASKLLSVASGMPVEAQSLLVFVDPASVTLKQRPDGVTVLTASELVRWLKRRKPLLDAPTIGRIADAAANPRTWHKTVDAAVDDAHLQTFAALRADVNQARVRRMLWAAAAAAAVAVLAIALQALLPAFTGALASGLIQ